MYLLNHALGFYPYPSWGSEWPLSDSIDIEKARGANISETILILHPKTYDFLKNSIVNDVFNLEEFNKNSENINK